ncbi:Elongation factor 1-gamma [Amphibalanus amphitrite]|uniref:Elongation factor 1-gamma n=1 Tax=Amphibalanus amphitrite TaxID=1232801 RepID=A0A6A4VDU3_AMPAM|nr:elongation factor 1-gamma-like [Amphibalanus amphitrite]KAF0288552.1 Elongation factor 1-gamma [Amphibalanus amphitrite]KAF0308839.1 Elongation factor 1-gamma [Amphibalanus amphitrite]
MVSGKLYTYPNNFRAYKALVAAQYSGAKVEVPKDFVFGETNKSDAFLKKFPLGKVPAFEAADGTCIAESNAIAWFVANEQLRGKTDAERAQVVQWMAFADSELLPAVCAWTFPMQGIIAANKQTTERAKDELRRALAALNSYLLTRTYLAGERVTLADIACCCTLLSAFQLAMDAEFRKPYGNVVRWFNTIVNQPQVKAVIGAVTLCVKTAEPQPVQGGGGDAKKDKKSKKDDKKAKEEKKPSKKEAAPKEEADAADEAVAAEPKSKDPFAGLPKSSWDMEDFKRFYSNNDEDKSIPYFWEKFDKDNYSIWYSEYKYPEELGQIFMSSNLVGGMFQRLEKLRKNAFASVVVFGKNNDSSISGIWVWRGQELAFPLSPDWTIDYESYDWKKLDASSEETKKMVDRYFRWEGEDSKGRKANTGKIFK